MLWLIFLNIKILMINTYNLFAVPVIHGKLPLQPILHKKILSFVDNNYTESDLRSNRNGFQFHKNFEGKEEMDKAINQMMLQMVNSHISWSWLNVLGSNSYNNPHSHPTLHSDFSGVFYLSNENNNIIFTKDGETFSFQPKIFDFLIFTYSLVHYVLPENRKEKRICYAFNLKRIEDKNHV